MHYLNTSLNPSAKCFVALVNKQLAAFFAVLHFPHNKVKNFKKGHRLVVLPEYQGLGIGHLLSSEIAQMFVRQGFRFVITSNTKALYEQRKRDSRWKITRIGRASTYDPVRSIRRLDRTGSSDRITISYEFVGD